MAKNFLDEYNDAQNSSKNRAKDSAANNSKDCY